MITHIVLLRIKKRTPRAKIDAMFASIGTMKRHVPGLKSYSFGAYSSPEGLNQGFTHGFAMTFTHAKARNAYLVHPEHLKVASGVSKLLEGGMAGVIAFDFES